jgi:hypothetical protein
MELPPKLHNIVIQFKMPKLKVLFAFQRRMEAQTNSMKLKWWLKRDRQESMKVVWLRRWWMKSVCFL